MVERHSTIERRPESVLESWEEWGRERGAPPAFSEMKREAERFLAWLRAQRSYSPNSLHRYMVVFRRLCLELSREGLLPGQMSLEQYLWLRQRLGEQKLPEVVKLYAKYQLAVTGDERWERLYSKVRVPAKRQGLPQVLTQEQVRALLEECGRKSFELKVLVELVYETGARVGEVLGLRVADVSFLSLIHI